MKIRPYSKSELAQAYAPEITSQAALYQTAANMKRMGMDAAAISSCTGLTAEEIGKL